MRSILFPATTFLVVLLLALSSCQPEDPIVPSEEEVITSLVYTLTPMSGGIPVIFSISDPDGEGGDAPIITNGVLQSSTTYTGVVTLYNETIKPSEEVHKEVLDEAEEHQLFYENTLNNATIAYTDQDADGNDLGLQTTFTTGFAEQGTLTVILRHEPNKTAAGIAIDNATPAGGETDIEVTFNVDIQ
ncbi:MAG: type 1 periplasmic binding fold superfamily protein [Aureispira sp.]